MLYQWNLVADLRRVDLKSSRLSRLGDLDYRPKIV